MDRRFFSSLARRKTVSLDEKSQLDRCLTLIDLTALGVGSTLGLGVYVLAGSVAKSDAGPAVCISFLVAAVASAFAGLCYAEFASRVPKAGSAYVYSYVTVGEFVAYIIGWNLILEYVIGTASVARGLSGYIDALSSYSMRNHMRETTPMNVSFLGKYPDFLALGFVLLLTSLLAFGVKESTTLNNVFTCLNLITVAIVIVSGAIKADPANWTIPKEEVPPEAGDGGFAPFGMAGIMAGAAKCFFGFVGFDGIATTGEEAKNPQRNIPLAIVTSLIIIFLAYFGISTVLTMMWPYYLQDKDAPFPHVFEEIGWIAIKWIVTVGAIFALCTSLLGAMFPLPRVLYAMAKDGLIFKFLATVHPKTKTPLIATVLSGLLAGLMATLFDLDQLIDMMSIGTLLAYTIVAISVLILRYTPNEDGPQYPSIEMKKSKTVEESSFSFFKLLFNLNGIKQASSTTSLITNWATAAFCLFAVGFCAIIIFAIDDFLEPYVLTFFIVITLVMITLVVIISRQPIDDLDLAFKVPWVPAVPCCSVIMNAYLMLELDYQTWIRFVVWLVVGFLIYFCYGMKNSEEKKLREKNEIAATLPKGAENEITTHF